MQESRTPNLIRSCGIPCGIVAFAIFALFITWSLMLGHSWHHVNDPVTDPTKYPELLAELRRLNLAKHFPAQCPEGTLGFYFAPGFLQAPTVLQLRVRMSPSMIDQLKQTIPKSIVNTDIAKQPISSQYLPEPHVFWDPAKAEARLSKIPESFEYWNHHGVAKSQYNGRASWNHGEIDGIAIDRKNSEILYYSECW